MTRAQLTARQMANHARLTAALQLALADGLAGNRATLEQHRLTVHTVIDAMLDDLFLGALAAHDALK